MRRSASEKLEIIRIVQDSELGINRSIFYQWYRSYLNDGFEGLKPKVPNRKTFWNKIPVQERNRIVEVALDRPELSPRELAFYITDNLGWFINESSVYRILKERGLITSPAWIVMAAADKFKDQPSYVHEQWQTDFTYFKVIGWGWYYLSTVMDDYSRYIINWELCNNMETNDAERVVGDAVIAAGIGEDELSSILGQNLDSGDSTGLTSRKVTSFFCNQGDLWTGTRNGLNYQAAGTNYFHWFSFESEDPNSLISSYITMISADTYGDVWVATRLGGLSMYDRKTNSFINYTMEDGLAGNDANGLLLDRSDYLWVSTENGISRFDPVNKSVNNYNTTDGLQGNQFIQGSAYAGRTGMLYFGGTNGYTIINPERIRINPVEPRPIMINFIVNNRRILADSTDSPLERYINESERIGLKYKQSSITLEFTSDNHLNPSKNMYSYRLVGFNDNWTTSHKNSASYSNLNPGNYTFELHMVNNDGIWSKTPLTLDMRLLLSTIHNLVENRKRLRLSYGGIKEALSRDETLSAFDSGMIRRAHEYIVKNCAEPEISTTQLAYELNMSRTNLHRKLKSLLGQSTTEFIRNIRIGRARELLETTDMTISEISFAVGITSKSYFSKVFREIFGMNPSEYRKNKEAG